MKKILLLVFVFVFLLISAACQQEMTDEEILARAEEILAKNATPTPKPTNTAQPKEKQIVLPNYVVEGTLGGVAKYITVLSDFTDEGLLSIAKLERKISYDTFYFFLPNAPRKQVFPDFPDIILPDKEYSIAVYFYNNGRKQWVKLK